MNVIAYRRNRDGHQFVFWFDDSDAAAVIEQCRIFVADPQLDFDNQDLKAIKTGVIDQLLANEPIL